MAKRPILKLNASYFPLSTSSWEDIVVNICSGAAHPLDIVYAINEDGSHNEKEVDYFNILTSWKEWAKLPIRACDDYVHTVHGPVRLPSIVVAAGFNRVVYKTIQFPTKQNIFKRDNYTCGYTGRKLKREELSVDHILPTSRGGQNTWTNLITCAKDVNNMKDNKLPQECGLKLLWEPKKPSNGMVFDAMREDWNMFLGKNKD